MIKTCKVCGVTSDVAEFYKSVNSRCKECHKRKVRENRAENVDHYRTYDAHRYRFDPRVKERNLRYAKTEAAKKMQAVRQARWIERNADKRAAHIILGNAVRDGRIERPAECQKCGSSAGVIHGHHHDYTKPLDVLWVCPPCHAKIHIDECPERSERVKAALMFDPLAKARRKNA